MRTRTLRCDRCNGCGRIAGTGPHERPWNAFSEIPSHLVLAKALGMQRPEQCPNCAGRGRIVRAA
jgi:hypothetical protein